MSSDEKTHLDLWFEEDQNDVLKVSYRVSGTLYSAHSEYQRVDVVDTPGFGKMLFNDNVVMISERDEHVYHEMIAHVPLFVGPPRSRVLVIGGGDGGTVREVLRHPSVTRCKLVEIDGKVVEACREHIPQTAAALDDPRVEVAIEDGVAYTARTDERYDLILVDSSDPMGPAEPLFGPGFYAQVHRILTDDGIVVAQGNSPFYEARAQAALFEILGGRFSRVHVYNYSNLTYPGGLWSFTFAAKGDLCPVADFDTDRVSESGLEFRYYNADIHRAAFVLPEFQRKDLSRYLSEFKRPPFARP